MGKTDLTPLQQRFLPTKDFTTLFVEFKPPPYTFVTTIKGFLFPEMTPANTESQVRDIVEMTLFRGNHDSDATTRVKCFLVNNRDNISNAFTTMDEMVTFLSKTITVERLDLVKKELIGTGEGKAHPAWNLYMHPPTRKVEGLYKWRDLVSDISFVTLSNRSGSTQRTFLCIVCRSENHPTGMCRFPDQPGWVTPPPPTQTTPANGSFPSTNNRGGPPTYRGGRGNTNGGRGRATTRGRGRGTQRA